MREAPETFKPKQTGTTKYGNLSYEDWHNAVLVLVSLRLGLKKVQKEYF